MKKMQISRRSFIVGTGASALGVSFGSFLPSLAQAQTTSFSPVAWVSISPDNIATIYSAGAEMGQGTKTALPLVIAENMELDWARVKVEQAPPDAKRFGNPKFGGGMLTGASRTVQGYYEPLRLAGLQAKLVMIGAAAKAWGVPEDQITAERSVLTHRASNRTMTYGDVARVAQMPAELPKVDKSMLKPMSQFKLVGTDVPRVDAPSKTNGSAIYGLDVRMPGLHYAAVLAAPVEGEKPEKVDDALAKAVPGVKAVVTLPGGVAVVAHKIDDAVQVAGVNSPVQLAELERAYQLRVAHRLMEEGVRLADPARIDVRGDLFCAHSVSIDVNCVFEGQVNLGEGVSIGANCVIANAIIEAGAVIHPFTHIDGEKLGVTVGAGALIGPFARLRPGARLGAEVHIGNFVEVKNSTLAKGAKANHLAYLGDATVGERVNFGAGSITANYDGSNKHRTTIEADVHVGSNCVLVAPITLGAGGTVGGGSTLTKDTPPGALSVARGKQVSIANWSRPQKATKA